MDTMACPFGVHINQVPLLVVLKMKNSNTKLEHKLIHRIRMDFNMLHNCTKFVINKITISKTAFNRGNISALPWGKATLV